MGAYIAGGRGPRGGPGAWDAGPRCRRGVKPGEWAWKATVGRQVADLSVRGELDGRTTMNFPFSPVGRWAAQKRAKESVNTSLCYSTSVSI